MVNARTRDPADGFASLRNASDCLGKSLTNDAPPVCAHSNLESRMSQDRWSPFDRVDLGHQSTVDNARLVEDLITAKCQVSAFIGYQSWIYIPCPAGMAFADRIADGVMLKSEQSVQHLYTEPPIVIETCLWCPILGPWNKPALFTYFIEKQLAVRVPTAQTSSHGLARSINLGAVPPGGIDIAIAWAGLV
jgi:hypothetical protein